MSSKPDAAASLPGIRYATGSLGRIIACHFDPGVDVLKGIQAVAAANGLRSGVILSGAGSLEKAVLRNVLSRPSAFPISDANRVYVAKEEPLELLTLAGNIAARSDGTVIVHGHMVISSGLQDGLAYGGHLVEGSITFTTMEIILAETGGVALTRAIDPISRAAELYFE